ncbi:sulfotransferase domain-containing protein [Devosia sp. ZB163]|uniref:sulfotransferase domain-containing protein n=1 Tax=Devosia sp. ZB163 TaxID=3025938 RepID=UPI0030810EE3
MRRIHIVGVNPRTGTTLLAECMRLCFRIDRSAAHEERLYRLRRCAGISLTKAPQDLRYLAPRLWLDPRFHAICMVRDPRDTVISKHGSMPDDYWVHTSIGRFKEGWNLVQRHANHPRFLWIKYEDLIARPDEVQDRIAARFPFLSKTGRFSDFHSRGDVSVGSQLALNGVRPIDRDNHGKWTAHKERLREKLEEGGRIDDELIQLGYEADRDWMARHGIHLTAAAGTNDTERARRHRRDRFRSNRSAITAALCARLGLDIG